MSKNLSKFRHCGALRLLCGYLRNNQFVTQRIAEKAQSCTEILMIKTMIQSRQYLLSRFEYEDYQGYPCQQLHASCRLN